MYKCLSLLIKLFRMVRMDWDRILSIKAESLTDDEIEDLFPMVIRCDVDDIEDVNNLRALMKVSQEMLQHKDNQVSISRPLAPYNFVEHTRFPCFFDIAGGVAAPRVRRAQRKSCFRSVCSCQNSNKT